MNVTARGLVFICLLCLCFAPAAAQDSDPPPPGGELTGLVLGPGGEPVSGATVRIIVMTEEASPGPEGPFAVETGGDGRFVLAEPLGTNYRVRAEADGFAPWTSDWVGPDDDLEVVLDAGHTVMGRVLDVGAGEPISGASVFLIDGGTVAFGESSWVETVTDQEGRYSFSHAPIDTRGVRAGGPAHTSAGKHVTIPEGDGPDEDPIVVPDLFLGPAGRITGVVIDENGDPVPDVGLRLTPTEVSGGADERKFVRSALSDPEGEFEFRGVPAGARYRLHVFPEEFAPTIEGPFEIEAGTDIADLEIRVTAGASLTFRLEPPDGETVGSFRVSLRPPRQPSFGDVLRGGRQNIEGAKVAEDDEGMRTAHNLRTGVFDVEVLADGWESVVREEVRLRDGETTALGVLTLVRGHTISGTITDGAGEPVQGALVQAYWRDERGARSSRALSGEDGGYLLAGLWEGATGTVSVRAKGFTDAGRDRVESDQEEFDFILQRPGRIRGEVGLSDGGLPETFTAKVFEDAIARNPLAAFGPRKDVSREREIDVEAGTFVLGGLDAGTFTVEVRAPGRAPARKAGIEVRVDDTTDAGRLELEPGIVLTGRAVESEGGAPVPGAAVSLIRPGLLGAMEADQVASPYTTVTDVEGRFILDGLEPGSFAVKVGHPRFSPAVQDVTLSRESAPAEVVVRLTEGGEIRGTVRDASRMPVPDADIMVMSATGQDQRMTTTTEDGTYRLERVAPGAYMVMRHRGGLSNPMDLEMKSATVASGEVTTVDFDEQPTISLRGRVLSGDAPVPAANLMFLFMGATGAVPEMKTAQSGDDGTYRVGLDEPGRYTVTVAGGMDGVSGPTGAVEIDVPQESEVVRDIVLGTAGIAGRVLDDEGRPVSGATVNASLDGTAFDLMAGGGSAVAATDGSYAVTGLEPGTYTVVATAEGFAPSGHPPVGVAAGDVAGGVDFTLETGRTLRGRVVDPGGRPVVGAMVFAAPAEAGMRQLGNPTATDHDGAFRVAVTRDDAMDVTIIGQGWAPKRVRVAGGDDATELVVQLSAGGRVQVTVVGLDGAPRAGIAVLARPIDLGAVSALGGGTMLPPTSDENGAALLTGLAPGSYEIVCPWRDDLTGVPVEVREGEESVVELVVPD